MLDIAPGADTVYYRDMPCLSAAATARVIRTFAVEEEEHVIKSSFKMINNEPTPVDEVPPATRTLTTPTAATTRKRSFDEAIAAADTARAKRYALYSIDRESGGPWVKVETGADASKSPAPSPSPSSSSGFEFAIGPDP